MFPVRARWLLLFAVLFIWFGNLEYRKLIKPDEGRYAEIPREMAVSGDWVTPRLNGLKYFEKPPLQYWATATAYKLFGEHQWTARIWAALTGFFGLLLVWFAGARLFGREAGLYAALLLGSSMLYAMMAHVNTLDMGVTFFITLGIVSLLLGQQSIEPSIRRNWMWLAWVSLGLAVLSKGLMGMVLPGAALIIYSVAQRDLGLWKRMHWGGILLFLLVTIPWFYLVIKANPEFFQRFFIYEHFTRFSTKELGRYQPWYYFFPVLLLGMLPWTLLMFDVLWRSWKESSVLSNGFSPGRFLLVWVLFVFLFFSASGSKLASYLLPMFPALALLMGRRLAQMDTRRLFWLIAPILPLALVGAALSPFASRLADTPLQLRGYSAYSSWLLAASLVWLLGLAVALLWLRRGSKLSAVVVLSLSTLVAAQTVLSGYNTIARERSAYYIAEAIRPLDKPEAPFYSIYMYEQTLPFYLKRTFTVVDYQDELLFGIQQEPNRWVPNIQTLAVIWSQQPTALAIIPASLYSLLRQYGITAKEVFRDDQYVVVSKP